MENLEKEEIELLKKIINSRYDTSELEQFFKDIHSGSHSYSELYRRYKSIIIQFLMNWIEKINIKEKFLRELKKFYQLSQVAQDKYEIREKKSIFLLRSSRLTPKTLTYWTKIDDYEKFNSFIWVLGHPNFFLYLPQNVLEEYLIEERLTKMKDGRRRFDIHLYVKEDSLSLQIGKDTPFDALKYINSLRNISDEFILFDSKTDIIKIHYLVSMLLRKIPKKTRRKIPIMDGNPERKGKSDPLTPDVVDIAVIRRGIGKLSEKNNGKQNTPFDHQRVPRINDDNNNNVDKIEFEGENEKETLMIEEKDRQVYFRKKDFTVEVLFRKFQRGDLILQPEFQRKYIWDLSKASRLIESALLDVPLPIIYLAEEENSTYSVIDGQQRLQSFFDFINNKFKLRNLPVLSELNKLHFMDLEKKYQSRIQDYSLSIIIIRKESHSDLKFEIFTRLNLGTVKLNDQELRNCIYRGNYNDLIKELAQNKDFLFLLGLDKPHTRMKDCELVLHFFAFLNQTYFNFRPPMRQFLNREMEKNRTLPERKINEFNNKFIETFSMIKTVFGKKAFRRFVRGSRLERNGHWESRINLGLFRILSFSFAQYEKRQIIPISDIIREELFHLMTKNEEFINSISGSGAGQKPKITKSFQIWLNILENLVKIKSDPRSFSLELKERLYEQNSTCSICKNRIMLLEDSVIDHIEHYWRGGKTIPSNARLVHRYCNFSRGGRYLNGEE